MPNVRSLRMSALDPRQPALLEWIASLPPEAELVMRMAMREAFDHCRGDRFWNRRIDELMAELDPDQEQIARILTECDKTVRMIRETV
ncbi:MAG TPA: hypothetical protein VMA53_28540 [Stellaceae bacterium]|nr:hypothetical protein [Stellaceae bacterium]